MQHPVSRDEFDRRLVELCLTSGLTGLPRKRRDQHILMKSVVLTLDAKRRYTEREIDDRLAFWLADIARSIDLDRVSLRRLLVDESYLKRSRDGSSYWVGPSAQRQELFEADVDETDVYRAIGVGMKLIQQRKRQYTRE